MLGRFAAVNTAAARANKQLAKQQKGISQALETEAKTNQFSNALMEHQLKERSRLGLEPYSQEQLENISKQTRKSAEIAAGKPQSFLGKTASVVGNVLNSPLLYAAPMFLPMIPSNSSEAESASEVQGQGIDPVTRELMQRQALNSQMMGYMGGM